MLLASVALSKSSTILLPSSLPLLFSTGVEESSVVVNLGASLGIKSPRILLCTLLVCMDLAGVETFGPFLWAGRAESIWFDFHYLLIMMLTFYIPVVAKIKDAVSIRPYKVCFPFSSLRASNSTMSFLTPSCLRERTKVS